MALKPDWHSSQTEPYGLPCQEGPRLVFKRSAWRDREESLPTGSAADLVSQCLGLGSTTASGFLGQGNVVFRKQAQGVLKPLEALKPKKRWPLLCQLLK